MYSETCLNRTPLGLAVVFGIDRCSVYTDSKFSLYRILFHSGFELDRFYRICSIWFLFVHVDN